MTRNTSHYQLVFGLTVSSTLVLLGLGLQSIGEDGFASVCTGGLLMALNMAQFLLNQGRPADSTAFQVAVPSQGSKK